MSEHTPGPWKVHVRPSDGTVMVVSELPALSVANVTDYGEMPARANARLIAAAPDMLRLLDYAWRNPGDVESSEWWVKVRRVLNQAKGEST